MVHATETANAIDDPHDGAGTDRRDLDVETRYEIARGLYADYDLSYDEPRREHGRPIPIVPTFSLNGGLTIEFAHGFSATCRANLLDDRPGDEGSAIPARAYIAMDLLVRYGWWSLGTSLFAPGDPFGIGAGFEVSF